MLLDLVNNPVRDWHGVYRRASNSLYSISEKINIFVWSIRSIQNLTQIVDREPPILFTLEVLDNHFSSVASFYHALSIGGGLKNMPYWSPYWGPYLLGSNDQIIKDIRQIGGKKSHMVFYYKGTKPDFNALPFTFNETIKVILDENIPESPTVNKEGHLKIWEEDHMNPLFIKMLIEKINSIICGK